MSSVPATSVARRMGRSNLGMALHSRSRPSPGLQRFEAITHKRREKALMRGAEIGERDRRGADAKRASADRAQEAVRHGPRGERAEQGVRIAGGDYVASLVFPEEGGRREGHAIVEQRAAASGQRHFG